MTLDEAIKHCEEVAYKKEQEYLLKYGGEEAYQSVEATECEKCAEEHYQLADWLKELKRDRRILADLYNRLSEIRYRINLLRNLRSTDLRSAREATERQIAAICAWREACRCYLYRRRCLR